MKHLTRKLVTLMCTIAIALAAIPMGMAFAATLSDAPQTMAQYQAPDSDGKTVYIQFKTFWANYLNIDKTEMDFTLVYESEIYPMSAEDTTDKKVCFNNVPNGTYSVYCNDEDTGKKITINNSTANKRTFTLDAVLLTFTSDTFTPNGDDLDFTGKLYYYIIPGITYSVDLQPIDGVNASSYCLGNGTLTISNNDGAVINAPSGPDEKFTFSKVFSNGSMEYVANEQHSESLEYIHDAATNNDASQHNVNCTVCGKTIRTENCNFESNVVAATCTEDGYTEYTCADCGYSYTETIPATDHNYVEVVTDPTCTTAGYSTFTCSKCGDTYTVAGDSATGHVFGDWQHKAGETHTHVRSCEVCGEEESEDCTFEENVVAATCTEDGYTEYTCADCGYSYTETIPATDHNYVEVVTDPTCTTAGYSTFTCSKCGDTYTVAGDSATGHVFGDWQHKAGETHTHVRSCEVCGEEESEDCTFEENVVAATCTEDGYTEYTCADCGYSYTETIPATDHNYVEVVTDPTCTTAGYSTFTCSKCGDTYTVAGDSATGHVFGDWQHKAGETHTHVRSCEVCGEEESEDCDFELASVTPASLTAPEITTFKCRICGHEYEEETAPMLTPVPTPAQTTPTPTPSSGVLGVNREEIENFVTRLYRICLNREPELPGSLTWIDGLADHRLCGVNVAYGFFYSPEFQSHEFTNEQYVTYLYSALLNRESDTQGIQDWTSKLDSGAVSRDDVFRGFVNSTEFYELCKSFGVTAGIYFPNINNDAQGAVNCFVDRLYVDGLGRIGDKAGQDMWTNMIITGQISGSDIVKEFLSSEEFTAQTYSNDRYVQILYATCLNRAADSAGHSTWVNVLNGGATRDSVLNEFLASTEFTNRCLAAGIQP